MTALRHERSFHNHALPELLEPALRDFYEAPGPRQIPFGSDSRVQIADTQHPIPGKWNGHSGDRDFARISGCGGSQRPILAIDRAGDSEACCITLPSVVLRRPPASPDYVDLLPHADPLTELNSERSAISYARNGVQLCQVVERQFRLLIRQGKPDDNVLTAQLTPKRIRTPLLRLRPAQTVDPNKVPLRHKKRPKARTLRNCGLSYCLSPAN